MIRKVLERDRIRGWTVELMNRDNIVQNGECPAFKAANAGSHYQNDVFCLCNLSVPSLTLNSHWTLDPLTVGEPETSQ